MESDQMAVPEDSDACGQHLCEGSLEERIRRYWDMRAEGYSRATRVSLERENDRILRIIGSSVNLDRRLRVADMGTGAGLTAIQLALRGHEVTAVDNSPEMLDCARENAAAAGVDIDFVLGDVQDPPLKKGSFDLAVSRNTVWNLTDPAGAYSAWKELLLPGGSIVVIDGNYYLDLYDEDYRRRSRYMEMTKHGMNDGLHAETNVDHVDFNIIRDIAKDLPMSRARRPAWDVSAFMGIGMTDIRVRSLDSQPYSVLTHNGLTELPSNFVISAKSPAGNVSPLEDATNYPIIDTGDVLGIHGYADAFEKNIMLVLKAMSDEKRMRMISALMAGRLNVSQLAEVSGCSQSLTSHNLRFLKEAGVVEAEKSGKETLYRLSDRQCIRHIVEMCEVIREKKDRRAPERTSA
ncbi:MAG: metalloregulator ArsR/SmtB family transcription factor [Candidatus Methanomethylophilus sp.]|jgi:SAM-dependent methyltransferase/DNA-binding transcriptional ArsR family regulator|nr:metalloregulator ArsR/SmtB family transcription factor [Methanomethylophilus sp.]MCI2093705.1 metalloregulator ArsR/SmtB family transcription factor [Methanomethylophilus sp.]